jgi:hypothetical protein
MSKPFTLQSEITTASITAVLIERALEHFEMETSSAIFPFPLSSEELEEYNGIIESGILNHMETLKTINRNILPFKPLKITLGELAVELIGNSRSLENIWNPLFSGNWEEFLGASWTSAVHPDATPE